MPGAASSKATGKERSQVRPERRAFDNSTTRSARGRIHGHRRRYTLPRTSIALGRVPSREVPREGPEILTDSLGRGRVVFGQETLPPVFAISDPSLLGPEEAREEAHLLGRDPHVRLAAMDGEGVDANIIYPTIGLMFGNVKDVDLYVALCQAYNNWARDFCSAAPDRLFAQAVVPQLDVFETLKETERAIGELGLSGIMMRPNPIGRTIEDPAWDPLWSLLERLDAPVGFHEGTQLGIPFLGADRTDNFLFKHMMSHPFEHMVAMLSLIGGGTLERHPNLRVLFLEAGSAWAPYWLKRMDEHLAGQYAYPALKLNLKPSEYFRRQCFIAADAEEAEDEPMVPAFLSCLGADNLCWTSDFPHRDHEWRGMVKEFIGRPDIAEDSKRKLMGTNVARAYGFKTVNGMSVST